MHTAAEVYAKLSELHAGTGWEWGITLTASSHVVWNAEIRVTPDPRSPDSSDRSYVTYRIGATAEDALSGAFHDMSAWLAQVRPPDARECFACGAPDLTAEAGIEPDNPEEGS